MLFKDKVPKEFLDIFRLNFVIMLGLFTIIFAIGLVFTQIFIGLNLKAVVIILITYILVFVAYIGLIIPILNKKMISIVKLNKERYLAAFYTVNIQMDIITDFFLTLEKVKFTENRPDFNVKFEKLKSYIEKSKQILITFDVYNAKLKSAEKLDSKILEDTISQINNNLYELNEFIIDVVSDFTNVYADGRIQNKQTNENMATLVYFLSNIIPIISDLSSTSNKYSRQIIISVIDQFENIADYSGKITDDIQKTMQNLMDEQNKDSLAFIIRKAHEIVEDFEVFFLSMEKLKSVSNHFVDTSINKLKGIGDIADSIEEISETIKVISLNVSIEAANTGSAGKGFQVLARDLRTFAQTTRKFAQDVKIRVNDTILTTENLKDDYMSNMDTVYKYVEDIKRSIESFESIIVNSFEQIKDIINTLREFSNKISVGIKEIVGKLQYYDITSQEVDHLSMFIERIFKKSSTQLHEFRIDKILNNDDRAQIKKEILETIQNIITTKNERSIYNEYKRIFGFGNEENAELEEKDINKNDNDDSEIIIF